MVRKHVKWWIGLFLLFPLLAPAAGPDILLKDFSGKERNVNEFVGQGKWTVVVLWASDCPICNQEIHHMAFFHDEHHKKDAIVLGVSIDGLERKREAQKFVERHGLDFTNLLAEAEDIVKFPGPFFGTPTYYIYSPTGELLARQIGAVTQEQVERFIKSRKAQAGKKKRGG